MSVETGAPPSTGVRFGDLLGERIAQADEVQRDAAEWLTDWMDHHDLDHELGEIERTVPRHLEDDTLDAIANIRRYRLTNRQAKNYEVGQAAISKWRNGHGGPSPEKWVAIATYMGLPLGEFYRLLVYSEMPRSIPALQHRLYGAERSLRDLRDDNQRLREENQRSERALTANAERLAELERRLQDIEASEVVTNGR